MGRSGLAALARLQNASPGITLKCLSPWIFHSSGYLR
jgi:hypothetical protein